MQKHQSERTAVSSMSSAKFVALSKRKASAFVLLFRCARRPGARVFGAFALALAMGGASAADPEQIRIGYLGPLNTDAYQGALQGLDEANAQGKFLGQHYELVTVDNAMQAGALSLVAIVVDRPAGELIEIATQLQPIPVINITSADDELRQHCDTNLLHTIPSDAMHTDAVQQWRQKIPESQAAARAWHPAFEKYAAAQLNKRYLKSAGRNMSDEAWSGWAAVKLLSAVSAERRNDAPSSLLETLRTRLAFDGQKGVDMSFRPSGQLRQPLLLIEDDRIVGEAPVRGVVNEEDLDSLGPTDCAK
jgi:hypothetical protein